jgi:hypothetical protein
MLSVTCLRQALLVEYTEINMIHGITLWHDVKDGDALLPLLLKFSVEYILGRPQ